MDKQDWENLFKEAINALRTSGIIPIDTGNLAYNSIKAIWVSEKTFRIYIDESVAPYAKYTIEPWSKGENPNQGWLDRAVLYIANYISRRIGGTISG